MDLPKGVKLHSLQMHRDERGIFTELFRQTWTREHFFPQWNLVSSEANVLRGVHVHIHHSDYLIIAQGAARIGLRDLRPNSPTRNLTAMVEMTGDSLQAIFIPPGVAHGFYFHKPSLHIYSVTHYWNLDDELGCHFADPELAMEWPTTTPVLSPRDAQLPPLRKILSEIPCCSNLSKPPSGVGKRE